MAIKGQGSEWRRFSATMDEYENIRDFIMDEAEKAGLSAKEQMRLELGMEETVVNVIKYAMSTMNSLPSFETFSQTSPGMS